MLSLTRRRKRMDLDALAGPAGRTAYLAGAAGSGMRGLARILLENGWELWGADRAPLRADDPLVKAGLRPLREHEPQPRVSLAVRSAAVAEHDPGYSAAVRGGARPRRYAEFLGDLSRLRPVLAVCGAHGKSTTTAWIAFGLRRAGLEVGFLVGAEVRQLGACAEWGRSELPLIVESCEYARSFHELSPQHAALTNVDAEHPDTYPGGLAEVTAAFRQFLARVPAAGRVFASPEAPDLSDATPAQWIRAAPLSAAAPVGLPGLHNRRNAALVAGVLRHFGLGPEQVLGALAEFRGAQRRLEEVGRLHGALVVSDYAHHPTEVEATLQAARELYRDRRILVVFQPHQAVRFQAYRERFAASLRDCDGLLLLEVYRARDPEHLRPSVRELLPLLPARPQRPLAAAADFVEAEAWLRANLAPEDVVLCFGAGDVDAFARRLAR